MAGKVVRERNFDDPAVLVGCLALFWGENDLQKSDHWIWAISRTLQDRKKKRKQIVIHQLKRPKPCLYSARRLLGAPKM